MKKKTAYVYHYATSVLIGGIVSLFSSCTYDSRVYVEPIHCDTTNIVYNVTIRQILTSNCLECHSTDNASGGLNFETYAGITPVVKDGRLIGAIKHLPGYVPMPEFSAQLADCEIGKIQKWINNGAPNN